MRRRDFIKVIAGGATATWPLAAHTQQPERVRRIAVLMNLSESDPEGQARVSAFENGLAELGWKIGHNIQIDLRWGAGNPTRYRTYAAELVALAPDVVVASNTSTTRELQRATSTVPIVFAGLLIQSGGAWLQVLRIRVATQPASWVLNLA
jgi:putative ABC transport system substrate-binding protein